MKEVKKVMYKLIGEGVVREKGTQEEGMGCAKTERKDGAVRE